MNQFSANKDATYDAHNWHIWVEEYPHALFSTAIQERFYIHYSKNKSSHFFELRYFFYILRDLNQTWNAY
jgi:hypothetical protein